MNQNDIIKKCRASLKKRGLVLRISVDETSTPYKWRIYSKLTGMALTDRMHINDIAAISTSDQCLAAYEKLANPQVDLEESL